MLFNVAICHPKQSSIKRTSTFLLVDDPNEENDLAQDPAYADDILRLKNYIMDLLADYKKPLPELTQHWGAESNPANYGGAWTTGWCENVNMTV
jgi:hypothetical protein